MKGAMKRTGKLKPGARGLVVGALALGCALGSPGREAERAPELIAGPGRAAREALHESVELARIALEYLPRETFDAQAVVDRVGREPEALFAWVRDHTWRVPYQGCLRGWRGVLMDRLGNDLDRALLLRELLARAGVETRVVSGTIDERVAAEIEGRIARVPAHAERWAGTPQPGPEVWNALAERLGTPAEELRRRAAADDVARQRLHERALAASLEQMGALRKGFGWSEEPAAPLFFAGGVDLSGPHYWVQASRGGEWIDLDPLTADATPGQAHGAGELVTAEQIAALHHRVVVRVLIERLVHGRLTTAAPLEVELRTADWAGESIELRHVPLCWPERIDARVGERPSAALRRTVLSQGLWLPVLAVGDVRFERHGFRDTGELLEAPRRLAAELLAAGPNGGARAPAVQDPGQLTALWIEYEVRSPGVETRTVRREVFDLIGPARRHGGGALEPAKGEEPRLARNLRLLGTTEMLMAGWHLSPEFVASLGLQSLVDSEESLAGVFAALERGDAEGLAEHAAALRRRPLTLCALELARQQWTRQRDALYLDRPNVISLHRRPRAILPEGLAREQAFDLVHNPVAVLDGEGVDSFRARVEQGVLDTLAEGLLLGELGEVVGAGELFAQSASESIAWHALSPPRREAQGTAAPDVSALRLPPDAAQRVLRDLAAGYAVFAPERPVAIGGEQAVAWYRIDPVTGGALGVNANGWGGAHETLTVEGVPADVQATVLGLLTREWAACALRASCIVLRVSLPGEARLALGGTCEALGELCALAR